MNNFKKGDIVELEFEGKYVKGQIKKLEGDCAIVRSGEWSHHLHTDHLKLIETGKQTINHPAHYNQTQFECIDEMVILFGKQAVIDWCKLTSYKYKYRANYKENLDEDLKKADWYLAKAKELEVTE